MAKTSTYPLRLPTSLKDEVAKVAKRDGTSVNQFIALAVAEKVSAIETEEFFKERGKLSDMDEFKNILYRQGGVAPSKGDELP
jgi:hypothetical protein